MREKEYDELVSMLDDLQAENEILSDAVNNYREALYNAEEEVVEWKGKWEATDKELEILKNHLNNMRQEWADERCSEWGHYVVSGRCTDCRREASS